MSAPIISLGTTASCPHGVPGTIVATGAKVLISGTPAAVEGDTCVVAGCPFTTPEPKPQPCVKAELKQAAQKVKVGGSFVVLVKPSDMCKSGEITNGPLNVTGPQTKVLAT